MCDRKGRECFRHLRMAAGEEPRDEGAPIMSGHAGLRAAEGLDDRGDIFDETIDRVVFHPLGRVAEPIASKIRRHGEVAGFRQRVNLLRPGLGTLGESMQKDGHLSIGGSVDQGPETKAVRLDHVLRGGHLQFVRMNSAATSSAWSSTLSRPWPWPLKI